MADMSRTSDAMRAMYRIAMVLADSDDDEIEKLDRIEIILAAAAGFPTMGEGHGAEEDYAIDAAVHYHAIREEIRQAQAEARTGRPTFIPNPR